MSDTLTQLAYQTVQQGKSYFGLAHKTLSTQLMNWVLSPPETKSKPLSPALLMQVQQRLNQLIERDWQDADQGVYPKALLFDHPWDDFLRYYPLVWLDMPGIWSRSSQKQHQVFDAEIETRGYPSYYLQNFHHQTNGYLSDLSANLYDLQVEILFNGSADAMRRRILAPLKQGIQNLSQISPHQVKILDVACGTGRTLKLIRGMLPQASLHGTDLSPAYLRKANQLLSQDAGVLPQLLQANAEELPYSDRYFHAVTSVFLFHELPPQARQNVIDQCFRVLQPGGTFIICDSIQLQDSPEFEPMMEGFAKLFHEPYYRHYVQDNLTERLRQAGFTDIQEQIHFMSHYWIARKSN
jgi:ubiquinone/menaquinone biosynthesis C-methylase UbiE